MARKKQTVAPPAKVSTSLGNHLLDTQPITSPVTVVEHVPVKQNHTYTAPETVQFLQEPMVVEQNNSAETMVLQKEQQEDPDYALYYYSKSPKNFSAASAWFGSAFALLSISGVGLLVLLWFIFQTNNISIELPYKVLAFVWLFFLSIPGVASIGCGVYGLFTSKHQGYSRKPAVGGILTTLFGLAIALIPVFLIW